MTDAKIWLEATVSEPRSTTQQVALPARRRILFVDDDPDVLDGLKAVLRQQRREWETVFAVGGPAALIELSRSVFDVVVTDMRMPIIDGAELLRQVKELQPRAVRIVLSGQTDAETAMRTVFTAHQFLAKPCEIDALRGVVRRACALNEIVCSEDLKELAGDVSQLPAAPRTYGALTQALANPTCNIADLAAIVERDPALSAKILQVVNSAFFGLPRKVSSVAQATSYLGTLALRNLALAMEAVASSRAAGSALTQGELGDFQVNALFVGLLGRHWFGRDRRRADEAFAAGMLRDMGHLVLAGKRTETDVGDAHAPLSAYLLGLWGLPQRVVGAVGNHLDPRRSGGRVFDAAAALYVANHLVVDPDVPALDDVPPHTVALDLDYLRLIGVAHQLDEWRRLARAFGGPRSLSPKLAARA